MIKWWHNKLIFIIFYISLRIWDLLESFGLFVCFFFHPFQVVHRSYSWFWAEEFLVMFWGPYGMMRIESQLAMYKAYTLPSVLFLQPFWVCLIRTFNPSYIYFYIYYISTISLIISFYWYIYMTFYKNVQYFMLT